MIIVHATARTPTLQNKVSNAADNLSAQATPMGLLLGWLGAKLNEVQPTSAQPKRQ